jgi:CheY-like chemotaxis protein
MTAEKKHILFVDDNPGDRGLAREAIEKNGMNIELHTVCDGEEALEFLRREDRYANAPRPRVIVLDLNMPRMDGIATLKAIKTDHELMTIPVIIFSSSSAPSDLQLAYGLHANAYVIRPMEFEEFTAFIRQIETFWCNVATVII